MSATATEIATCRVCHCRLSQYRGPDEPPDLCALHADAEPDLRVVEPETLVYLVAGILLEAYAVRPGERAYVRAELAKRGIWADRIDVRHAVRKLERRYGWNVVAVQGETGHALSRWPYRFHRRRFRQLTLV